MFIDIIMATSLSVVTGIGVPNGQMVKYARDLS